MDWLLFILIVGILLVAIVVTIWLWFPPLHTTLTGARRWAKGPQSQWPRYR